MKKVYLTDGNIILYATLNDTVAAFDFAKRLPCHFTGVDSGTGYNCTAANGVYDPLEMQTGWKNGDIALSRGLLSILYSGEEQSNDCRQMMIIGNLEAQSLPLIAQLPHKVILVAGFA